MKPIDCKCGTSYDAEEHPAGPCPTNEVGYWYTCPGCGTTSVIWSDAFKKQYLEASYEVQTLR